MTIVHEQLVGDGILRSVVVGAGLTRNITDPKNPVLNINIPTQAEAESGIDNTKPMTALRVAQSIAKNSSPDLDFTVAQIIMRLADIDNVAQFLGPNGNRFADSYDTLTYVDVAGATNLDSSSAGILKPVVSGAGMIPQIDGGIIGNFTTRISAVFDGITNQSDTEGGYGPPTGAYIGKGYGTNTPRRIDRVQVYGSNTTGHAGGGDTITRIELRAKNGSAPTSGADGTLLGSFGPIPDIDATDMKTITNTVDRITQWQYVWISYIKSGSGLISCAELQLYEVGLTTNLTVSSTSFSAPITPTKMKSLLNVREVETAVAGTDYFIDVSRDGGVTWSVMTLNERYSLPSGIRVVEGSEIDVSGQPSGTAPRYRLRTANNKNVEFHDTYLYWS